MGLRIFEKLRSSLAFVAVALIATACDPCVGNTLCDDPTLDVTGRATVHLTGGPAADIRVEFRSLSGARLTEDTVATRTDADGIFHLRAPARRSGTVIGELAFLLDPPWEEISYGVELQLETTRVEGATTFIGSWGVGPLPAAPHIRARGRLLEEYATGYVEEVKVTFERTGGAGLSPSIVMTHSNDNGEFLIHADVDGAGIVSGRLTLDPGAPFARQVFEGVEIPVFTAAPLVHPLGEWTIDFHLAYAGELQWGDGGAVNGAEVTFTRTGGIPTEPEVDVMTTGGDGRFWFSLLARDLGTVEGELVVLAPGASEPVHLGRVELETFVGDPRLLGIWWLEPSDNPMFRN